MSKPIGIIGVGHLAGFLVAGAKKANPDIDFILSPRNAETSSELATKYNLEVASCNQDVVDRSQLVIVSVLPKLACDVLRDLEFRKSQTVLSVMAGVRCDDLKGYVAPAAVATAMLPGLANAIGIGPSILYPENQGCREFLETLGPVHGFADWSSYEVASVFGGFSGATFSFFEQIMQWFISKGIAPETARNLVAQTVRGNAQAILESEDPMAQILDGIATKGGISELAISTLSSRGADKAWGHALDEVFKRITSAEK